MEDKTRAIIRGILKAQKNLIEEFIVSAEEELKSIPGEIEWCKQRRNRAMSWSLNNQFILNTLEEALEDTPPINTPIDRAEEVFWDILGVLNKIVRQLNEIKEPQPEFCTPTLLDEIDIICEKLGSPFPPKQEPLWGKLERGESIKGKDCEIILTERPDYCDRGRWLAQLFPTPGSELALDLNTSDGWTPGRYYFDYKAAKLECVAWLKQRGQLLEESHECE